MFTAAGLLDLHTRTQRALLGLLDHCEGFSQDALHQEHDGFGYRTIALQLHHMIGAERYWVGVLGGEMLVDEHEADHASIQALRAYRDSVSAVTVAYLQGASEAEINTPRVMTTWGDKKRSLVPSHVLLRTQTHVFQHQGQVAAMARLLGRPLARGLDFPLS